MVNLDLTTFLDRIPEAVVIVDADHNIVFINRKARDFQRWSKNRFDTGSAFINMIPPDRVEIVTHIMRSAKTERTIQVVDVEFSDENGRILFYECVYDPTLNEKTEMEFACVFFREKTVEKIFEKRSTQMLQQYATLIENANAVIFSIDSNRYITDWNAECQRVTQFEKDEVFASRIEDFIDEKQLQAFSDFVAQALNGIPSVNFELEVKRKDASVVIVLLNATPRISSTGNVVGALFVGHDITELWQYRQSLEEQIRDRTQKLRLALEKEKELVDLKNRFVSMASHEFRMPLSTISSSVNHIRGNATLRESETEKLLVIDKQIAHMRLLIDDVLTIGKGESAKLKASKQALDIISFLRHIIEEVTTSQRSHEIIFTTLVKRVEIESDEKLLRNIFINLLTNAIKFSPEAEKVDMRCETVADDLVVTVMDYGIGIKAEDLERVFTPFNRGSNTGAIKGTGLGLSIVKRAAEALGGSIAVDSTPGQGTSMTVKLPLPISN